MLRLSETHHTLNIVGDQIGGPTPASDIALACLQIAERLIQHPSKSGTYHFSGAPDVSWADFAREIFDQAGKSVAVTPIPTTDYAWLDTGTHASLLDASNFVRTLTERQGLQVGSPDEVAYQMKWLTKEQLGERAATFRKNKYGQYLEKLG
jgi:dTDP-4-dehydrorhamnose reductase